MATLENIRKRGPLVAIIIGFALLAFILGDFFTSGNKAKAGAEVEIARVFDEPLSARQYYNAVEELRQVYLNNQGNQGGIDSETEKNIRKQVWDDMIKDAVLQNGYQDLGIDVSPRELFELTQGNYLHPIISQIFANKETGEVDRSGILNFLKNIDNPELIDSKNYWLFLEKQIYSSQRFTKYSNLLKKGMYVTSLEAQDEADGKNKEVNLKYVLKKFNTVSDSAVSFSETDVKAYYQEHINDFQQEASRDVNYVTFDVVPSQSDNSAAAKTINNLMEEFKTTEDDALFVNRNSDTPFDPTNFKEGTLPARLDTFAFSANVGDLIGPFFESNSYKSAKLAAINYLPDTVKASHILIKVEKQEEYQPAHDLLDSLKTLAENGADFAELAIKHSADGSAPNGGDLGWFGENQMVKPFNDWCFAAKVGDIGIVDSQFGVHLIKLTGRGEEIKKIQLAVLEVKVTPSTETYRNIYASASKFAGTNRTLESFDNAVNTENLTKRVANNLTKTTSNIAGLDYPETVTYWAYSAKEGEVSPVLEVGSKFVVAALTQVREKGNAPLNKVRQQVESEVIKEKKATMLSSEFESVLAKGSLDQIATDMGLTVETAEAISFGSFQIPGVGMELPLIGASNAAEEGKIQGPLVGVNGVYVFEIANIKQLETNNSEVEKDRLITGIQNRAEYGAYEAYKKLANIEDLR